jgi:hypothetical protein
MSSSSNVNLIIEKGTDFEASFTLTGDDAEILNFTNSSAIAILKKYPTSPISYPFKCGITTEFGEISISMGRTMTATLPSGRTYFDVFVNDSGLDITSRVVAGSIIVEDTTIA